MNGKLIIVDGISNSGKTTLCNSLVNEDTILVEEVPKFIANNLEKFGSRMSSTIPKTIEEEKNNQEIFFQAELERLRIASEIVKSGKNAVLDRSFFSTVAIAFALDKKNSFKGSFDNASKLLREYVNLLNALFSSNDVYIVILDVDKHRIPERNKKRVKPLSLEWIEDDFLNKQRHFFDIVSGVIKCEKINTTDLEADDINEHIKKRIRGKKK